ncbi:PulJ/GspJ family protein [Novosphingobium sp.]|uniref:PulJ/GspJ family protein n=1 Tax=Novosphingobium sp. TaxID=1874826 RepID=UPI003BAD9292
MSRAVSRFNQRGSAAGFTLAEMLVALALFGMISALLASVINLIVRLDDSSRRQGDAIEQVASAQDLLRARIEQMRPQVDPRGAGDTIAMVGLRDEVTFTAPGLAAGGAHQLQAIRLKRTAGGQLVLFTAPLLAGPDIRAPAVAGWSASPLLDGVQTVELAYYGADRITGQDVWQDRWLNRAEPPKLVRMRLGFATGDARSWPVLIVRPMSGVRLACPDGRQSLDCGEVR